MSAAYRGRLERLRRLLEEKELCRLVVDGESNVFYYTGYRGAGFLLVDNDNAVLLVPVLEYLNAVHQVERLGLDDVLEVAVYAPYGLPEGLAPEEAGLRVYSGKKLGGIAAEGCGGKRCGVATSSLGVWRSVAEHGCEAVDVLNDVWRMRMVKEPWEVERMMAAARVAEAALDAALNSLEEGVSEAEVAGLIVYEMMRLGADGYSFPPIVAFGVNTVYPHAVASRSRVLKNATPVLIDLGAKYEGYSSDMTRTLFYGGSSPEFRHIAEAVLDALNAAIDAVHAGVTAGEVDAAARRVLRSYKLDKYFIHSLGHGIGIDVHEPPRVSHGEKTVLEEGMVVTIEPGVYIPGKLGVRIEEMVLVSKRKGIVLTRWDTKLW